MRSSVTLRAILALALLLAAAPIHAQSSPYMSAGVDADIFRRSHASDPTPFGNGEVLGGSLRLGTSLGERWGVEVEFARSAALEIETTFGQPFAVDPLAFRSGAITWNSGTVTAGPPGTSLVLPVEYSTTSRLTHTGLNTAIWFQQSIGDRVSLNYLAGVAFVRQAQELSLRVTPRFALPVAVLTPSIQRTDIITYETGALVGFEARIGLTDHVRVVPGIRLQGVTGGWLLRPGVSLGWRF